MNDDELFTDGTLVALDRIATVLRLAMYVLIAFALTRWLPWDGAVACACAFWLFIHAIRR